MATEPAFEEEEVDADEAPASDFDTYAADALGISLDEPGAADKIASLKMAIVNCVEEHERGGYEDKDSEPKGGEGLALIFGGGGGGGGNGKKGG